MRVTLKSLKEDFQSALEKENYAFIDEVISEKFWGLKKVVKAFERYIGTKEQPRRINSNPYDTPDYFSMKPSEQGNVEGMFIDDVLTSKREV